MEFVHVAIILKVVVWPFGVIVVFCVVGWVYYLYNINIDNRVI